MDIVEYRINNFDDDYMSYVWNIWSKVVQIFEIDDALTQDTLKKSMELSQRIHGKFCSLTINVTISSRKTKGNLIESSAVHYQENLDMTKESWILECLSCDFKDMYNVAMSIDSSQRICWTGKQVSRRKEPLEV